MLKNIFFHVKDFYGSIKNIILRTILMSKLRSREYINIEYFLLALRNCINQFQILVEILFLNYDGLYSIFS